ncbi:MAG: hypothetical protein KDA65_12975 [Planctomycetaceae bacterium]|nr:hypothetical protein [Planctomycetaceae bacterium]
MRLNGSRFPAVTVRCLLAWLMVSVTAFACSVPVFRYAIEQWSADAYEVLVFHREPLDETSLKLLQPYQQDPAERTSVAANVHVRLVDLNQELSEADQLIWSKQTEENENRSLPRLVVRYPTSSSGFKGHPAYFDAWSADWSPENYEKLLDSPARREIARRLIKGETAVWVLLRSGDKEKDDSAREALHAGLQEANETLELPEIEEQDIQDGLVNIDPALLKVNFTSYELDKNNKEEAAFISMLLGSEDDLQSYSEAGDPMVFPVFGRGRVLYSLIGQGISKEMLLQSCTELIGPCTCQVKEENPGTDIVMNVDWDNLIESTIDVDKELPPLQGLAGFTEAVEEDATESTEEQTLAAAVPEKTEKTTEGEPASSGSVAIEVAEVNVSEATPVDGGNSFLTSILAIVGVGLLLLVIGTFFIMRKTGSDA